MPRSLYTPASGLPSAASAGETRLAYEPSRLGSVYLGHASDCRCAGDACAEQERVERESRTRYAAAEASVIRSALIPDRGDGITRIRVDVIAEAAIAPFVVDVRAQGVGGR